MRICFFGTYERDYPRNQILLKAIRAAGAEIVECHYPLWDQKTHKVRWIRNGWLCGLLAAQMMIAHIVLWFRYFSMPKHDFVMIGYPGHLDVIMFKLLHPFCKKPIVFDAFISLQDAAVNDRKLVRSRALTGRILGWADQLSVQLVSRAILDTNQQIDYFADCYRLPQDKFRRIFAGADDTLFKPDQTISRHPRYRVLFCGKFTPFHGVKTIIDTAAILESETDIEFNLVGTGQEFETIKAYLSDLSLTNTHLHGWVPYSELPSFYQQTEICLGVFGKSDRTDRVIPNKIFQSLASKRPVITAQSAAVEELLSDMESVYFVEPENPEALAAAITTLKNDTKLSSSLANNGYETLRSKAGINATSLELCKLFDDIN